MAKKAGGLPEKLKLIITNGTCFLTVNKNCVYFDYDYCDRIVDMVHLLIRQPITNSFIKSQLDVL